RMITTRDLFFFFQAEDGIRDFHVTGVQTCALPICPRRMSPAPRYAPRASHPRHRPRQPVLAAEAVANRFRRTLSPAWPPTRLRAQFLSGDLIDGYEQLPGSLIAPRTTSQFRQVRSSSCAQWQ